MKYFLLECPLCEAQCPILPEDAQEDGLLQTMAAHVFDAHPETRPADSAALLERSLEDPKVCEIVDASVEPNSWTMEILPLEEPSDDRSGGSPLDDLLGE